MAVVKCGSPDCEHCESGFCQKSNISLLDHYFETKYDGVQHFWKCRQYRKTSKAAQAEKEFCNNIQELEEVLE